MVWMLDEHLSQVEFHARKDELLANRAEQPARCQVQREAGKMHPPGRALLQHLR